MLPVIRAPNQPLAGDSAPRNPLLTDAMRELQSTFPVHVGHDFEAIVHPASVLASLSDLQQKGVKAPPEQTMRVPRFWNPPAFESYGGVRPFLGQHGQRLMSPAEAAAVGSRWQGLETIYVSVASYRDPECSSTVQDLYERARHPERIRVAILDQRSAQADDPVCSQPTGTTCELSPEHTLCRYAHLIDYSEFDARLSVGPVFARHLANRHYRGEYFAMQVDSHVRFVEHWDEDLVGQWKSANNEMAILTTYLSDLNGSIDPATHESKHRGRPIMCVSDFEGQGQYKHLRHGQQPEGIPGIHGTPTLHPFWAAGFSFARGHFVVQVPYDQYLPMIFQGEEISIGLRAFSYGYDFYTPERGICFHMYAIKDNEAKRKKVPLFWENAKRYAGVGMIAMRRLNGIIGMGRPGEDYYHEEESEYGLGQVRDPQRFFQIFGIHLESQTVEKHLCQFVGKRMQRMFTPTLRENHMGLDYDKIDFVFVDPAKANANANAQKAVPNPHLSAAQHAK